MKRSSPVRRISTANDLQLCEAWTMSEQPNAEPTPAPLPAAPSPPPAVPKPAAREAGQRKQRCPDRKPAFKAGPVPAITDEQAFGVPPSLHDLDAEIAGELEEAMGGLSDKDLYGEEQRRAKAAAPGTPARKKGKVLRIHGP